MSVAMFLVRAVVEAVERTGLARSELRVRLPFDWCRLEQPESRLDFEQFGRVLAAAMDITGDEALGLHMAEHVTEGAVDLLAHMISHAPALRDGVATASQFVGLAMDGVIMTARDEGDTFTVRYAFPRFTPRADRMLAELFMGGLVRLARTFTDASVGPRLACFEHERPDHHAEYRRIFGENYRFGQAATSMAFNREIADRPQMHQHPELYDLLRTEAQRRLDRMTTNMRPTGRLRQHLLSVQPSRIPAISAVARELGMSERSLRRHLATEGTSYRDVLRSTLETSAGRLLRDPARTIKQTAVALGFANAAAFSNAFKRWTGMTPGEYRRAHAKPAS
jgi:AraC-like DNA-binding protein